MELNYTFAGHSETMYLPEHVSDEEEYKNVYESVKEIMDHLLNMNYLDNDQTKQYIMSKEGISEEVKKALYKFYKYQGKEIIRKTSQKTAVASSQGILDIDWDVNIIAGGKDVSNKEKDKVNKM